MARGLGGDNVSHPAIQPFSYFMEPRRGMLTNLQSPISNLKRRKEGYRNDVKAHKDRTE